jgi:putative N-acetylmannosamine-6-phosphate epimerase
MTNPKPQDEKSDTTTIEEIRDLIAHREHIVVTSEGKIHKPEDAAGTPPREKTVLKPGRWF